MEFIAGFFGECRNPAKLNPSLVVIVTASMPSGNRLGVSVGSGVWVGGSGVLDGTGVSVGAGVSLGSGVGDGFGVFVRLV